MDMLPNINAVSPIIFNLYLMNDRLLKMGGYYAIKI